MKIAIFIFLAIVDGILGGGGHGGKHHVHLKIHVPEIIKHHIHTKTVFIHVHTGGGGKKKEAPKKKENHLEESHHEDYSSWSSSYDHHGGHEEKHGGGDHKNQVEIIGMGHLGGLGGHKNSHQSITDTYSPPATMSMEEIHAHFFGKPAEQIMAHPQSFGTLHDTHQGLIQGAIGNHGVVGYSHPPQYAVHETVNELPHNNLQHYQDSHEEGYRKGLHSETGHVYSDELKKFYDDKHDEADMSLNNYQDELYDKSHAQYYANDNNHFGMDDHDSYKYADDDHLSSLHAR
ncbi:uncharacterized protein LOC107263432 [Cephus cinctus]|uniref:Uncharacterized protein LOC107263432 n=1 Tax=Cephus cinctus TaxID=211228 RepID=A0AAJ7FDA8_CEPCN|nr:uncharacterized protein LOC107263432 [Cephus cinctus]